MKTFLMKVLYDALQNDYTKYKYAIKPSLDNPITPLDPNLPPCPLCATSNDSLSHLLCSCTHPIILTYRTQLIHRLNKLKSQSHINSPHFPVTHQITSNILANIDSPHPDHRNLLGLFHIPSLPSPFPPLATMRKTLHEVITITAPFIKHAWTTYCDLTHPRNLPSPSRPSQSSQSQPSRLIVISGNNATLSLETVQDHSTQPPYTYAAKTIIPRAGLALLPSTITFTLPAPHPLLPP